MKTVISTLRAGRSGDRIADGDRIASGDDTLGRGMDLALTILAFLILGAVIDNCLGFFPLFTLILVVFAADGSFIRMKYVYDATMERHEAQRLAARRPTADDSA